MKPSSCEREAVHHNFAGVPGKSLCVSGWYLLDFPKDCNNVTFLELLNNLSHHRVRGKLLHEKLLKI